MKSSTIFTISTVSTVSTTSKFSAILTTFLEPCALLLVPLIIPQSEIAKVLTPKMTFVAKFSLAD